MGTPGWVAVGIATLTLLGLAGGALTWVYRRILKPLSRLIVDWFGEEQRIGIKPRPGVMERLMTIEDRLAVVPALESRLLKVERRLAAIETQMTAQDRPRVEASASVQAERAEVSQIEQVIYGFRR